MKTCPSCQTSYPVAYTLCPRDGNALVDSGAWAVGTIVRAKYRILSKLGEGGMAVVYKAMHMRFEELRALKVMKTELAGDHGFVKRFMQEAVLTRKIQHPNAVRVEDIDETEDGCPFMVMEFLEGRGLKDVIEAEAPMAPARVSLIARQIAGALSAAHRLGVVHRDVKPANIVLIGKSGYEVLAGGEQAKVLDFGIAKARERQLDHGKDNATLTHTGNVIGTPTYMSPEQARGMRGADLDGRSDLYSLGIVMYQMLAGGLPFNADTSMEWILAHVQTPPKSFREFRPDLQVPPALAEVVMRCLEKDPARRPGSAEALIEELEHTEGSSGASASSGLGRAWADPARVPDAKRQSGPQSARNPTQELEAVKPSRSWIGWTAGVLAAIIIAGGLVVWRVQSSIWGANPIQHIEQRQNPPVPQPQPPQPPQPNPSPNGNGGGPELKDAAPQKDQPAPQPQPEKTPPPQPKPPPKPPGFIAAVERAKDDESQGRFEDALRDYQQAARLDPTDASVRRHIVLLQERISKENELIR
jgi:eukaryotic-like serine/threonine-protein kinase